MTLATEVKIRPADYEDRLLAQTELGRNIVVMAGAGTGKTTLLIDRLVLLIIENETPVDRIVALTFTKKAAEEMRERLEYKLREIINDPECFKDLLDRTSQGEEKIKTLAQMALDDIPKSQIGTIHGFAGSLLRLYPVQAGVDPQFREDEGHLIEEIFESEWRTWIREELKEDAERASLWREILLNVRIEDLKELGSALVSPMVDLSKIDIHHDLKKSVKNWSNELQLLKGQYPSPERSKTFLPLLESLESVFSNYLNSKESDDDLRKFVEKFPASKPPKAWFPAKEKLISHRTAIF